MADFNKSINIKALVEYRNLVGFETKKNLPKLIDKQIKVKPTKSQIERLQTEGVVTDREDSIWLVDFWERKTIASLLQMPITRPHYRYLPYKELLLLFFLPVSYYSFY